MPLEMECPGITFAVQWKKKSRSVSRHEDATSIGLWDFDDSALDWQTFKSYVCQNLGTSDNISVAYVDSDGDELPIESECEFREALKFARQRAINGRETVLKVARQESSDSPSFPTYKMMNATVPEGMNSFQKFMVQQECKDKKSVNTSSAEANRNMREETFTVGMASSMESHPRFLREKTNFDRKELLKNAEKPKADQCESIQKLVEQLQKFNLEHSKSPPPWFRRHMHQMKNEIVEEVTANILREIRQHFPNQRAENGGSRGSSSWSLHKSKKKKKVSDEESSDGALGCESRDHKLLKKIEKIHKREKKLEKKLDSKLEKLENKTKRMMEKKSQCKARCERVPEKKLCSLKRRSGDLHFRTYLMDAAVLNDGPKSEIIVSPGECFVKVWEIMNAGTLPWTDKTELRQAWGTYGLDPEETIVKCPSLQPGEKGTISVKFHASEFPGTFKSYWHFYHMGDRFGHWIGCAVVVKDPKVNQDPELDDSSVSSREIQLLAALGVADTERKCASGKLECDKNAVQHRRVEYESDFESDNLSVISGPGSVSSETEDENFVIIPMPACFVCDIPLGSTESPHLPTETVPMVVKADPRKTVPPVISGSELKGEKNLNKAQCQERRDIQNHTEETSNVSDTVTVNSSKRNSFLENSMPTNSNERSCSDSNGKEYEDRPRERVYAVDARGCCVAVNYSAEAPADRIGDERDETGGATGQDPDAGSGEPPSSASKAPNPSRAMGQDPLTNVIHILPETLVTGAVNVASSAFSTARAVISNLRSRPSWEGLNNVEMLPTDGTTSGNLEILKEMGFTNRILNVLLLQQYENDLVKVIAELVSYEDDTTGNQQ